MNKLAFGALLMFGAPLAAPVLKAGTVLTDDTSVIDGLKDSGLSVNPADYQDHNLITIGKDESSLYLYWIDKSGLANLPDSVFMSVSNTVDKSQFTGYQELYSNYPISIYNKGNTIGGTFYCFKVMSLTATNKSRFLIQSLRYGFGLGNATEVDYPTVTDDFGKDYGIEYTYHAENDSFTTKTYESNQVTDKFVSYFNTCNGNSEWWGVFCNDLQIWQQHYIAFNFPVDIDEICNIQIQSQWYTRWGKTAISWAYQWQQGQYSKLDWSSLDNAARDGAETDGYKYINYSVSPDEKTFSYSKTVFGLTYEQTKVTYKSIMDLTNTEQFKSDETSVFGGDVYSQLVGSSENPKVFSGDGTPKYRWFVNFAENYVHTDKYGDVHPNGLTSYYVEVIDDAPLRRAKNATIVSIRYKKAGKTYESLVVDQATNSTIESYPIFVPEVIQDLPQWVAVLISVLAVIAVVLCLIFLPKAFRGLIYLLKLLWWMVKLVIDLVYLALVWWWLAIIKKSTGDDVPPVWIWPID